MFLHNTQSAFPVWVEKPNPSFAKMLQQTIGGEEGRIRVMLQYLLQGFGTHMPLRYRNMLLNTGIEEIGHIEMLATAVALNLEGAPLILREEMVADPVIRAVMNGHSAFDTLLRQFLSAGLSATCEDAQGVLFNDEHVYVSGDIVADMHSIVAAETTSRASMCQLYEMTNDPGMKDMLWFLIAHDTMHQQRWLAVITELESPIPTLSDYARSKEQEQSSFLLSNSPVPRNSRCSQGSSLSDKSELSPSEGTSLKPTLTLVPPRQGRTAK